MENGISLTPTPALTREQERQLSNELHRAATGIDLLALLREQAVARAAASPADGNFDTVIQDIIAGWVAEGFGEAASETGTAST